MVTSQSRRWERGIRAGASRLFRLFDRVAERFPAESQTPRWAPGPLIRGAARSAPPLGFPRTTDSLCPECVKEVRAEVLAGKRPLSELIHDHPGEIPAQILQQDGEIRMVKRCTKHGRFDDVLSIDPAFLSRIESRFPGRDYAAPPTPLRDHGASSVKYGRGAVLTVDLTNRCNMMCDPCFMDANQVGYVHELEFAEVKKILDDALTVQPRRQLSVQFSGGEPTLSPHFLDAISYARELGYFCVQCATNGVRFAQDLEFCRAAKRAGLRLAYLQFDGISNEAHWHRKVGNLFDVKCRAIENLHAAGIDVVLVVTVVRGVNDDQVGDIVRFAIDNADKVTVVSFQPVSFTGRDEDISDALRKQQRYTLSHLAHDLHDQLGATEPLRDWYPLSAMNPFSDVLDLMLGPNADFGALKCGCHPNCGIGTVLLVHKKDKRMVPLSEFVDLDGFLSDLRRISDAGYGKKRTMAAMALALLKAYQPDRAPEGYGLREFMRQVLSQMGAKGNRVGASEGDASGFEWRFLFVAGMWFQDLWNYDFRRTEMCIIPYGTQQGEISFCAYNTGVGFRQIVEKMHQTASVAQWYREHGKHGVYAKHQNVALPPSLGSIVTPGHATADGRTRLKLVG
ncbi:MAG: radical SAM protein [Polyangiaceae bacterium]